MYKIKNKLFVMIVFIVIIILAGCSLFSSKPDDIRQDIWDKSKEIYKFVTESVKNNKEISNYQHNIMDGYIKILDDEALNLTEAEYDMINNLHQLYLYALDIQAAKWFINNNQETGLLNDFGKNELEKAMNNFNNLANKLKILASN